MKFSVPDTEEGMMVWCDLSPNGLLVSYFFDETVTDSTYRQMLVDYAWPQLPSKRLYFQHDGAALHYAVIVREWDFLVVGLVDVGLSTGQQGHLI